MKIDPAFVLRDFDGLAIQEVVHNDEGQVSQRNDMTIKRAALNFITRETPRRPLSPEDKYKRFKLLDRICTATGEIDLSADEVILFRDAVGESAPPLIYGRIKNLLDPPKGSDEK